MAAGGRPASLSQPNVRRATEKRYWRSKNALSICQAWRARPKLFAQSICKTIHKNSLREQKLALFQVVNVGGSRCLAPRDFRKPMSDRNLSVMSAFFSS